MDRSTRNGFFFGLATVVIPSAICFILHWYYFPNKAIRDNNDSVCVQDVGDKLLNQKTSLENITAVPIKHENIPDKSKESRHVKILYGTCMGTARTFAEKLCKRINNCTKFVVEVLDLKDYNEDNLSKEDVVLFICSTWTEGTVPESAQQFFEWLKDYATDFRVSKDHLSNIKFAVFGLGGDIYGEHFAKAPKDIHEYLTILGATPILPVEVGDDASDLEMKFNKWSSRIATEVQNIYRNNDINKAVKVPKSSTNKASAAFQKQQKVVKSEANALKQSTKATTVDSHSTSCCQGEKSDSTCCNSKDSSHTHGEDGEEVLEEEEEDLINNNYITMDQEEDESKAKPAVVRQVKKVVKVQGKKKSNGKKSCGTSSNETKSTSVVNELLPPSDDEACHSGDDEGEDDFDNERNEPLVDLEDLGSKMNKAKRNALKEQLSQQSDGTPSEEVKREMVTKLQRKALTKEGYRIIGTHSAVKLCRWTKNQMRGRGGCYKHSFYGITSYQCMEATPSLACANKCVFCWRHHKNPVGTEWRWKEDEPEFIVNEAVELHRGMINEMRGVPGVQAERLAEAFTVRHCALSLVGEPIMYPRINEMLRALHEREISTFMVTNAQFPERIQLLDPVTQLYVSVDASNRESLKAIDRPLFKDFWERFLASLKAMSEKQQRTVYRMTLVSGWNMNEDGYVELIESGLPDFIEIKAMTYCGKSDASTLTMQNVPWHKDVCAYGDAICERLAERGVIKTRYSIATEHEHSCCILLAREDKFKVNGVWNTWIDYPKFNTLMQEYYASNGKKTFRSEDYMAPTPEWALYKSAARGFDPEEQRWHRNKTGVLVENEYKSSESGCG